MFSVYEGEEGGKKPRKSVHMVFYGPEVRVNGGSEDLLSTLVFCFKGIPPETLFFIPFSSAHCVDLFFCEARKVTKF